MKTIIQRSEDEFRGQVINFDNKISGYAVTLGIPTTDIAAFHKDVLLYDFALTAAHSYETSSQNYNAYKRQLRQSGGVLPALPAAPAVPTPAPAVTATGMEARFAALIQKCVKSPNFNVNIGLDLGIIEQSAPFDPQAGAPEFKTSYTSGGHPTLRWVKGRYQGVAIYKSLDGLNFSRLDKDSVPDFMDKSPLPAPAHGEVWYYKLIYLYNDEEVGSFSPVIPVPVHG